MRWRTEGEVRKAADSYMWRRGCYAPGPHADVRGSERSLSSARAASLSVPRGRRRQGGAVKLRCCERCSARLAGHGARRRAEPRGEAVAGGELRETAAAPGGDADAGRARAEARARAARAGLGDNPVRTNETLAIPASVPLLGSAHADARKRQRGDVCGGSTGGGRMHARTEGAEGDSSQARAAAPAGADSAPPRPPVPASAHIHRPGGAVAREAEEAAEQLLREMFE